jgi:hypothetical protein
LSDSSLWVKEIRQLRRGLSKAVMRGPPTFEGANYVAVLSVIVYPQSGRE